jgi:hypothetical protein
MTSRLRSISSKLFGEPPPKDAPRSQLLRWIRGFYLKMLPIAIPAIVAVLVWASDTWMLVTLAVSVLIWLQGLNSLSVRIRREERRERASEAR